MIYENSYFVKLSSLLTKHFNQRKENADNFIKNSFTKRVIDFDLRMENYLTASIKEYDLITFCAELDSKWLSETIYLCKKFDKPLLIRTTGMIKSLPENVFQELKFKHSLLVHSLFNYKKLECFTDLNVSILDQTSLIEYALLPLSIHSVLDSIKYGYIGRFDENKGVLKLLEHLNQSGKNILLAGNGTHKTVVKAYCERNQSFHSMGELSVDQIAVFFDQIDVLIIPSYEEAGPLVGVEAMAAGKIILSTKVGAMPDRLNKVQDNFWFDINNSESLFKQMDKIESMSQEDLKRQMRANRKHYLDNYKLEHITNLYLEQAINLLK